MATNLEAIYSRDSSGNVTGLVGPGGNPAIKLDGTSARPYRLAFWGDSRYNGLSATTVEYQGSGVNALSQRAPLWIAGYMGDAECYQSYAVSGDSAVNWASASRANGKTFAALSTSDADAVFVQYGINDAQSLTASATVSAALKALIADIIKTGKPVIFESINPVNGPAVSSYAAVQAIADAVNADMQSWLQSFKGRAIYADTASALKNSQGYFDLQYSDTVSGGGLHPNRKGAQLIGKLLAAAARTLLPKRVAKFYGPASPAPNLCNLTGSTPIATQFNGVNQGTTSITQNYGVDSDGYYYEWIVTPLTFGSTYTEVILQVSANFQTASPPFVALQGNELLQGGGRVVIDDGNGGAPNIYAFSLRQRFYTGAVYSDAGAVSAIGNSYDTQYSEKVDVQFLTPRMANATASAVANPASSAGYALQVLVDSSVLNVPYRVRLYNPQLRRVGYSSTPVAVTPPASTAAYTNNTNAPQQVFFAGGTVSAIAINGVATGLTSGVFVLNPGDTLTPTYTVAPTTFTVQQLLTQATMRGLM